MEFNKSRVYTALNADELNPGDKVIVAGNIGTLKWALNYEKIENLYNEIIEIKDENHPTRFVVKAIGHDSKITDYALAYLMERAENCRKCIGKTVNCMKGRANDEVCWCEDFKPKTEPHYRPFKDTDELIEEWDKKCQIYGVYGWGVIEMPRIWVKYKFDKNNKGSLITDFSDDQVALGDKDEDYITMYDLFINFTFLDGSPCGIEE